jgi:hypothetical protein
VGKRGRQKLTSMRVRGIVVLEYGKAGDYVRWYSAHWYKSVYTNRCADMMLALVEWLVPQT